MSRSSLCIGSANDAFSWACRRRRTMKWMLTSSSVKTRRARKALRRLIARGEGPSMVARVWMELLIVDILIEIISL